MGNGAPNGRKPGTPNTVMRINSFQNLDMSQNDQLVEQLRQGTPPYSIGTGYLETNRNIKEDRTGAGPRRGAAGGTAANSGNSLGNQIKATGSQPQMVRRAVNLSEVVQEEQDSQNFGDMSGIRGPGGKGGDKEPAFQASNFLNLSKMNPQLSKSQQGMSMPNDSGIPRMKSSEADEPSARTPRKKTTVVQKREPCKFPKDTAAPKVFFDDAQVKRLKKKFDNLDEERQGTITLVQLGKLRELHSHSFRERILELFEDKLIFENKPRVTFEDFLLVLSIFHPKCPNESKYLYAFRMYDINGDSLIDLGDLTEMLKKIFFCREMSILDQNGYNSVFANETYVEEMAASIMKRNATSGTNKLDFSQFQALFLEGDFETKMVINF